MAIWHIPVDVDHLQEKNQPPKWTFASAPFSVMLTCSYLKDRPLVLLTHPHEMFDCNNQLKSQKQTALLFFFPSSNYQILNVTGSAWCDTSEMKVGLLSCQVTASDTWVTSNFPESPPSSSDTVCDLDWDWTRTGNKSHCLSVRDPTECFSTVNACFGLRV